MARVSTPSHNDHRRIGTLTFVVKAVYTVDGCALVVAAQDEKVLWILDFVGQQQADCLQRLLAPVDVVAQEQVVRLRRKPSVFKKSKQVVVLPVNVTAYLNNTLAHALW